MSKERLVELIKKAKQREKIDLLFADIDTAIDMLREEEYIADYLLANGVIVPPCKVGQKLFTIYTRGINDKFIQESTVSKIVLDDLDGLRIIKKVVDERGCCFFYDVDQEQLNKTTFFSKEKAEAKLKESERGV